MGISRRKRAEAEPFYREGGEAIGKLLNYHPTEEPRIWALVAGTGIWKRWYLMAFKSIWRLENVREYNTLKSSREQRRRYARKEDAKLEAIREAAKAKPKTSERDCDES